MGRASIAPLSDFRDTIAALLERAGPVDLPAVGAALGRLVSRDEWLDPAWAEPDPARYQQHLLCLDRAARFSVVSFVWAPGQGTPIHDHGTWGAVGMLRGAEIAQPYRLDRSGRVLPQGAPHRLEPGDVDLLSPEAGDIHSVRNALDDAVSISVHVYGADIGRHRRRLFTPDGDVREFVSGYSDLPALLPGA